MSIKLALGRKAEGEHTMSKTIELKAADGKEFSAYLALPEIKNVTNVLVKYAKDHAIAYWNLYEVMGGEYSINGLFARQLVQPDRIPFKAKGYAMFADWLFMAFISAMQSNVLIKHNTVTDKQRSYVIN